MDTSEYNFQIPDWAGKPTAGFHIDILKEDKMIQKLMIDEKKCYFFGRNKKVCDFAIDHDSGSRVHAVLVWHKHLHRFFIIDLGSTHGTFIGNLRLEPRKPQNLPFDSKIRFGASTRSYVVRDCIRMNNLHQDGWKEILNKTEAPDDQIEVEWDNLTELNTTKNMYLHYGEDMDKSEKSVKRKLKKTLNVHFRATEIILNLEEIDPTVGRYRNLCETTIIPKRRKVESTEVGSTFPSATCANPSDVEEISTLGSRINSAPDIIEPGDFTNIKKPPVAPITNETKKKSFAKESWPGKRSGHSYLGS